MSHSHPTASTGGPPEAQAPSLPVVPLPDSDRLPAELRKVPAWIIWRAEWRWKRTGWTLAKVPCDRNGKNRDMTDPKGMDVFPQVLGWAADLRSRHGTHYGVGLTFCAVQGLYALDLDGDLSGGQSARLAWLTSTYPTWGEVSVSGRGAHLFYRGQFAGKRKIPWRGSNLEIFGSTGFVAMTGNALPGCPSALADAAGLPAAIFLESEQAPSGKRHESNGHAEGDDAELLRRMFAAQNGAKIRELWDGRCPDDLSSGDLKLCNHLAFWVGGPDEAAIDRLFRQSARMRPKWDERHANDGSTYGEMTIRKALAGRTEYRKPKGERVPGPTPNGKPGQIIEAPDDPHRLARLFIGESCRHAEGLTLRCYREEWHRWDGSAYRTVPEKELRAALTKSVKAEFDRLNLLAQSLPRKVDESPPAARKVKAALVADVAHALASLTILRSRTEAPDWIGAEPGPFPASETLACRNGLVNLPALVADKDYFRPPTPAFFSPNALDFDFDPNAPPPETWLSFLRELWPDDPQSIGTLQEWIGLLLTPDTRQQKMLLLVGPKRSGKGTIARVIRGLIGPENVAGPTLSSLGTNFGLWPLLGKTAAIISDARLSGRTDTATVTERLLSISGEDALTVDRKNLPPLTVKLAVRFSILTNELPRLGDSSGALTGRMVLLRMTRSWYGKEDKTLTDRLLAERPGILFWAIEGWRRLRERGHFVQPDDGRDLLSELDDLASPVGAFVRERCRVGPGYRVAVADLFAEWKRFCDERGRKEPGTEAIFGRDLLAALPSLRRVRPRDGEDRYRAYEGIGLR